MVSADTARVVLSTSSSSEEANAIAHALVSEHLAACVSIVPGITSHWWQGALQRDQEWLLLIKTGSDQLASVELRLKALHCADVPEILVLVPENGSQDYLSWMNESLKISHT